MAAIFLFKSLLGSLLVVTQVVTLTHNRVSENTRSSSDTPTPITLGDSDDVYPRPTSRFRSLYHIFLSLHYVSSRFFYLYPKVWRELTTCGVLAANCNYAANYLAQNLASSD